MEGRIGATSVASARAALERAVASLRASGALGRGSHANLSVRLGDGRVAMTRKSSVVELEAGVADALCVVDAEGHVVEGEAEAALAEVIAMHTRLYAARVDVGGVIHTHAPHLTAFALAQRPLELVHEPMLRVGVTRPVPVVAWAPRGSTRSVDAIVAAAAADPGVRAVLLANHGVLAFAPDVERAAEVLAVLEEAAALAILAASLGGARALPDEAAQAVRARMARYADSPV
jgi:ribulose-5-phosphate 4-epimerase/fuculose-1-phosphate aldolase